MSRGLRTLRFPASPSLSPALGVAARQPGLCGSFPGWLQSLAVQTEPVLPGSPSGSLTFCPPCSFHPEAGGRGGCFAGSSQEEVTSCGVRGPGWGRALRLRVLWIKWTAVHSSSRHLAVNSSARVSPGIPNPDVGWTADGKEERKGKI